MYYCFMLNIMSVNALANLLEAFSPDRQTDVKGIAAHACVGQLHAVSHAQVVVF